jgi:hypothetical protein
MPAFWWRLWPRVTWDTLTFMSIVYTLTRFGKNAPMSDDLPRLLGRAAHDGRLRPRLSRSFTGADARVAVKVATPGSQNPSHDQ